MAAIHLSESLIGSASLMLDGSNRYSLVATSALPGSQNVTYFRTRSGLWLALSSRLSSVLKICALRVEWSVSAFLALLTGWYVRVSFYIDGGTGSPEAVLWISC